MKTQELKSDIFYYVNLKMGWSNPVLDLWWITPNVNFLDLSPKEMVEAGMGETLLKYIKDLQ